MGKARVGRAVMAATIAGTGFGVSVAADRATGATGSLWNLLIWPTMPFLVLAAFSAALCTRRRAIAIGVILLGALTIYEFVWMAISSRPDADNSLLGVAILGSWIIGIPIAIGIAAVDAAFQAHRLPRRSGSKTI